MYEVIYRKGDRRFVYKHARTLTGAKSSARRLSDEIGRTVMVRSEATDRIWAFRPKKEAKKAAKRTAKRKASKRKSCGSRRL